MTDTELTVSISPYSARDLVHDVAHKLSEDTMDAIGQKVEEVLGESIDALVEAKLGEYLGNTVEQIIAEHYTPVTDDGEVGEETTLADQIRGAISTYINQPCRMNISRDKRDIVDCKRDSYNRPDGTRYELLVKESAREASVGLVTEEIAAHTAKMKKDATEAVKALVAEHIVTASQKRQLNGGLPT